MRKNSHLDQALLLNGNEAEDKQTMLKDSVLVKTIAFGLNGFFFAAHLVLNGKLLASYDSENGAGASSLMSTYQSVVIGSSVGFLLGTGLDFGSADGKQDYLTAGHIARTSGVLATSLGGISIALMLATRGLFPVIFNTGVAKIASDFFTGYSVGAIPLLFLIVGPQIAFQAGDWYVPPATMFSVFSVGGIASYLLGFTADLGALGIGLGGSIGSSLTFLTLLKWFTREKYARYQLYSPDKINDFQSKMKSLLSSGWKLSFQRLTEWGNLFIITIIVGAKNNNALTALNAGLLYLILFGTAEQGLAQAAGMIITKNKGAINKAIEEKMNNEIIEYHKDNVKTVVRSNLLGVMLNSVIFGSFYAAREPLTAFFLSSDGDQSLAEDLFTASMLGLIPDALRIIGAGALRGWKDLLYPTIVSFVMMTIVGISVAYGIGDALDQDDGKLMLYIRNISMLVSAAIILKRCHTKIQSDKAELMPYLAIETGFFGNPSQQIQNNPLEESDTLIP